MRRAIGFGVVLLMATSCAHAPAVDAGCYDTCMRKGAVTVTAPDFATRVQRAKERGVLTSDEQLERADVYCAVVCGEE